MKTAPSSNPSWARAGSALMLVLCLSTPAPTLADVEVPDSVFNDTFTGMAANDAERMEVAGKAFNGTFTAANDVRRAENSVISGGGGGAL
ncbi:MAG: hypothetical protein LBK99_10570 [Opitutaceae bacterium]|jgi:hypothetical protein|nr:hypothetical protein [Opitutaceae bacterium]